MNIILFGPPGVGKSTLIGYLKTLGQRAIDLEDVYPSRVRFSLPNQLTDTFIGGADLDPIREYPNALKVFLFMLTDEGYLRRRNARDAAQPGKGNQATHTMDQWYDIYERSRGRSYVMFNDGGVDASAKHLILLKETRGEGNPNEQPNVR